MSHSFRSAGSVFAPIQRHGATRRLLALALVGGACLAGGAARLLACERLTNPAEFTTGYNPIANESVIGFEDLALGTPVSNQYAGLGEGALFRLVDNDGNPNQGVTHPIVILDNLPTHKISSVTELISAQGASVRYLPPYSPDLNPIEQLFAKLKHWLREAAERSVEAVTATLGAILGTITPIECANYFANSGYAQT